jgi:hypothetical protein
MQEDRFVEFLKSRNQSEEAIRTAVHCVREFEAYLADTGVSLASFTVPDLRNYASSLIDLNENTMERFLALARYAYVAGLNEVFIYFTAMLGGREVLPSIAAELAKVAGEQARDAIFTGVELPPLGSPPEQFPEVTARLVDRLLGLGQDTCHKVLACNHHGIPVEHFYRHKAWFQAAGSIDAFLKKVHEEAIAELERHAKEGKIWYEQEITPEVVDLVRGDQEVLSAVRDGEYLYMTKIPYAPKDWLKATDPVMRRYYACHCPLARAAIVAGKPEIPLDWCYCSGGFEMMMFDVVFDEPTQVEVLESVLAGDPRCRFRVRIPITHQNGF